MKRISRRDMLGQASRLGTTLAVGLPLVTTPVRGASGARGEDKFKDKG